MRIKKENLPFGYLRYTRKELQVGNLLGGKIVLRYEVLEKEGGINPFTYQDKTGMLYQTVAITFSDGSEIHCVLLLGLSLV